MSQSAGPFAEPPTPGSPDRVLATARAAVATEQAAAVAKLCAAVEWAALHEPTDTGDAAYWWESGNLVPLAGEGAPDIAEFAVAEFATALGLTTDAGRRLVGRALELCYRLPNLWKAVQAGAVPAWRATLVADATLPLSPAAAGFVDRQVAIVAGRVSGTSGWGFSGSSRSRPSWRILASRTSASSWGTDTRPATAAT